MMNILLSATRQWNPGDEFILRGVINILEENFGSINPVIYNRNPDICKYREIMPYSIKRFVVKNIRKIPKIGGLLAAILNIEQFDNSFKSYMTYDFFDLCVFAGSPEWYQSRLRPLYKFISKNNLPTIYLGIGLAGYEKFEEIEKQTLGIIKKAKLITVRDIYTKEVLNSVDAKYLSCPALLSSKKEKLVKKVNRIALIYGTHKATINNSISQKTHEYIIKLYKKLLKIYQCDIVCHYVDELNEVFKEFPNVNVRYSYDSSDYFDIYYKYDLVIGPRIHGIGISASMGIPGIAIKHDKRGDTADGFGAKVIDYTSTTIDDFLKIVNNYVTDIEKYSNNCLILKKKTKQEYIDLIRSSLY